MAKVGSIKLQTIEQLNADKGEDSCFEGFLSQRENFPLLKQLVHQQPLIYLDNAATTQKPISVLQAVNYYYHHANANIHRGLYSLSVRATELYEQARIKIQKFINAEHKHEIIFTKGTTEGINLIAHCFSRSLLKKGDEIILSGMEHHSNIVPWQFACEQVGAKINIIPVTDEGELDLDVYSSLLTEKTKMVAIAHVSNAIGTINPIKAMIELAHEKNIPVLIDGAQAVSHLPIDVQDLKCDFYIFSGHKMYSTTGTGILYGKTKWLERLPPYQGGGDMIAEVSFEKTTYAKLPYKFEAGTPDMAGVVGLGAAVDYLNTIGMLPISQYEHYLLSYATERLKNIEGLKIIGHAKNKASIISFVMEDIHPHDIGTVLDQYGIAIRAGHHCAMPLMARYNVPATARISFALYNTREEIDKLIESLIKLKGLFG
jgi:cysteine desulfurase/selenocysteine lyase